MKNNLKDRNFPPKEKKSFNDPVKNLTNLRYTLTKYQIVGIAPPESVLIELKMAELLARVESVDTIKVKPKSFYSNLSKNKSYDWLRKKLHHAGQGIPEFNLSDGPIRNCRK